MRGAGWSGRTVRQPGSRRSRRGPPRALGPVPGALSGAANRSPELAGAAARLGSGSGGQDVRAGEYRPPAGTSGRSPRPGLRPQAARCRSNATETTRLRFAPLGLLRPGDGGSWGAAPPYRSLCLCLSFCPLPGEPGLWGSCCPSEPPLAGTPLRDRWAGDRGGVLSFRDSCPLVLQGPH